MPFQKGHKYGNRFSMDNQPKENGRPKKLPNLEKILASVLGKEDDNGVTEAQKIIEKLTDQAQKGNVRASEIIIDRGWGKPKQFVENVNTNINSEMTEEQLNERIATLFNKANGDDDSDTGTD